MSEPLSTGRPCAPKHMAMIIPQEDGRLLQVTFVGVDATTEVSRIDYVNVKFL
jgi:hypothetical protein